MLQHLKANVAFFVPFSPLLFGIYLLHDVYQQKNKVIHSPRMKKAEAAV